VLVTRVRRPPAILGQIDNSHGEGHFVEVAAEPGERPSLGGRERHSFVIRLWLEAREHPNALLMWRGRVVHVQSGRDLHFQDLAALIAFIHQQSGWPDPFPSWAASVLE
jgi:hypothetical protein